MRQIRPLDCPRKPFRNGATDSFVMTCKCPLGPLHFLRIWHDNGSILPFPFSLTSSLIGCGRGRSRFRSWYLSRVIVLDCQTGTKYPFVVDRWLAVDEDDGMIERMVPIAGLAELTNFDTLFAQRTKDQFTGLPSHLPPNSSLLNPLLPSPPDHHLWFSVFARPARSRFTRVQRLFCCLSLLLLSMLASAMWCVHPISTHSTLPHVESEWA